MRLKAYLCGTLLLSGIATLLPAQATLNSAGFKSQLNVSQPTQVPGSTLPEGTYTIQVVGHLSDRLILRVEDAANTERPAFIGLLHTQLAATAHRGAIPFDSGVDAAAALRGFAFPHGPVVEFVYPKDAAVALAKKNSKSVVAIDPASDGIKSSPNLSRQDMEVVTLWTLSSTPVGTDNSAPAIKAERYQQVASVTPKPRISQLPHTASELPLILLFGLLALVGAVGVRIIRPPFASMQ